MSDYTYIGPDHLPFYDGAAAAEYLKCNHCGLRGTRTGYDYP